MVDTVTNTLNIRHFVNGTNAVWIREELLEVAELWKRQQYLRKVKSVFAQKYNHHCELWTFVQSVVHYLCRSAVEAFLFAFEGITVLLHPSKMAFFEILEAALPGIEAPFAICLTEVEMIGT